MTVRCLALLIACALAGCSASPVAHSGAGPTRIVSLNPCSDAILAEVAPEKLVAVSEYSHDPSASSMPVGLARRWPATGGSVEDIIAARADMVVASSFLPAPTRNALDKLGIPVVTLGMANDVEGNLAQVRQLADAVGEREAGAALVRRIEAALADAAPTEGRSPVSAILWQPGGIVPGDGALVVDLMRREAVIVDPPQLLLHAGAQGDEQSRTLHHPVLRDLPTRRAEFSPQLYYCGGPSLIFAADRLAAIRDGAA